MRRTDAGAAVALALAGAVVVGLLVARLPLAFGAGPIVAVAGLGLVWLAYRRPFVFVTLTIWTIVAPTAYVFTVGSFGFAPYVLFEAFALAGVTLRRFANTIRVILPVGFWYLAAYMALTSVSALLASDQRVTMSLLVRLWLAWLVVFLLLAVVTDRRRLEHLVTALLAQAAVVVGVSVWSSLGNLDVPGFPSLFSYQFQKNDYATYLSFAAALSVGVVASGQRRGLDRTLGFLVLGLVGLSWPLTYSRSGLLALAAMVVTFGLLNRSVRLLRALAIGALLAALAVAVLPSSVRTMATRAVQSMVGLAPQRGGGFTRTMDERIVLNLAAVDTILSHPLLGIGLGEWGRRSPVQTTVWDVKRREAREVGANIHNRYLLIAAESGVLALVAYLAFVASLARAALRTRRQADRRMRFLLNAVLAATAGFLVSDLFVPGSFWIWILFAVLAACERVARQEVARRPVVGATPAIASPAPLGGRA